MEENKVPNVEEIKNEAAEPATIPAGTETQPVPDTQEIVDDNEGATVPFINTEENASPEAPAEAETVPAEAGVVAATDEEGTSTTEEISDEAEATENTEVTEIIEATEAESEAAAEPLQLPDTKQGIIDRLKEIVAEGGNVPRSEVEALKQAYYRLHNAEAVAARDAFVAAGGDPEAFIPAPDKDEETFKAEMGLIRELRAKAQEAAEKEKQDNLEKKLHIIEQIKAMAVSPDEADKNYDAFKQLQAEWKEIKAVPAERATELWKNYQLYVEQFYDQLRLNHEFRAYDFKKNLEIKTHLCEAAEKLAEVEDPVSAFHQLQKLHQEYRETGPVAKELREDLWNRFKEASTAVNKRHQAHFEGLKAQEEENLVRKTALCERAEAMAAEERKSFADWDKATKEMLELQAEWKTVGFTPKKMNAKIFERFRAACDTFFRTKTEYFKSTRETFNANLAAKNALCEQAEALMDSTDWAATTTKFVALQKEWKTIGPVSHKMSEAVWKRFNTACNHFFEKKNEATADVHREEAANLEQKEAILVELNALADAPEGDVLQRVRELQARWNEVGHVPFRKKEKMYKRYREVCDRIYKDLHIHNDRRRLENFKRNVGDKGGSELTRERNKLTNAYEAKRQEIQNYETNLTFFNSKSKSGNSLVVEIEKKVERLKEELALLAEKINAVNEQIKAEENK